jgi:hypothetical protein
MNEWVPKNNINRKDATIQKIVQTSLSLIESLQEGSILTFLTTWLLTQAIVPRQQ